MIAGLRGRLKVPVTICLLSPALSSKGGEGEEPSAAFFTVSHPMRAGKSAAQRKPGLIAAEHSRTPKSIGFTQRPRNAARFWSAAVLCRFGLLVRRSGTRHDRGRAL